MARQKTISSIDAAIIKTEEDLTKANAKYDKLANELQTLRKQRREHEAKMILDAYEKSGKSLNKIMIFLGV
ncbi:MAG: hypothetical protein PHD56_02215 [Anaerostipes sp.]|nr:hypothetical protein [Anaerostipes sp.]